MPKYSNKYVKSLLWISFCIIFSYEGKSQSLSINLKYLHNRDSAIAVSATENKPNVLKRTNPLSILLNGSLKIYQKVISPQFSANCLYELSCSRFSQSAIQEYGAIKGLALTADRLARCNRISATTINPFRINQQGKVIDSPPMYKIKQ